MYISLYSRIDSGGNYGRLGVKIGVFLRVLLQYWKKYLNFRGNYLDIVKMVGVRSEIIIVLNIIMIIVYMY